MNDINITQIDNTKVKEKVGKTRSPIHEKLFKEYNIDVNSQKHESLKPIPMSWVKEIIEKNINSINIKPINTNKDLQKRFFTLIFNSNEMTVKFEKTFQINMFKSINSFIEDKKENPKIYNRNIITTTEINELQLQISY